MDIPNWRKTAVLAVIPVITENKILILSKNDRIVSNASVVHDRITVVLIQFMIVDIDTAVFDLYGLSRHANDAFDQQLGCIILIWK